MKKILLLSLVGFSILHGTAQTGIPVPQMAQADALIQNFMNSYSIPGLTFAMAKNGKVVYMRSFGFADKNKTTATQPYNLFRIASLSKQITSIAIMKLMQDGKLHMSDKVFGASGLLANHPSHTTATITDGRVYNITVQQLLEHSAGWDRDINCNPNPTVPYPYYVGGCDPISFPLRVTQQLGVSNPVTENDYIKFMLQKGLDFDPGAKYAYSNMGYLVLGAIIEQLSGMKYEDYVQTNILHPLGIFDMHIGNNLLSDKLEREVEYTGGEGSGLSVYGDGSTLPWEYGALNVNAMSAHGGWVCTGRDLLTLLNAVDGFSTKPDILSSTTINTMVTPSVTDANYAKGWSVNQYNNWWHTGSLPGTASEQVRANSGYTWVVIMNHRGTNNNFWTALDNLGWNVISSTTAWPTFDLMLAPTQNAAGIAFSNITSSSITVNWTKGNGGNRLLLIRAGEAVNAYPLDGTDYIANTDYAVATALSADNKIVYNGSGGSVTVTGLSPEITYHFRVVEYNKTSATGNHSLYLLGSNEEGSAKTQSALPLKLLSFTAGKTDNYIKLDWHTSLEINTSHFEVQRSIDGASFKAIANVNGAGSLSASYRYQDNLTSTLLKMPSIYYRLKIIDKDGSFTYSPVALVSIQKNNIFISPNPAKNVLYINGSNIKKAEVVDATGKRLLINEFVTNGVMQFNTSRLASGVYFVRITDSYGSTRTERIIIR